MKQILVGRGLKSNITNQIGVIVPSFNMVYFPAVLQGIHEAAVEHGYTVSVYETNGNMENEKKYVKLLESSWSGGYVCMRDLLRKGITFNGVFAASDQMAIGAMKALLDEGIKVPEEVGVIGLDNNFPSTLITPSLSSVNFPKLYMGYKTVELLSQRIREPDRERSIIVLDTKLVVRQSTSKDGDNRWNLKGW